MPDESGSMVRLAGSERAPLPHAIEAGPLDASRRAEVTLVLRRRAELPEEIVVGPTVLSGDELAGRYGADPADVDLVRRELSSRGLQITAVHPVTRRVKVAGTLGDLSSAFGTTLRQVTSPDPAGQGQVTHRYREGALYLPAALGGVVTAVLGLDTRPQARPHFRTAAAAAARGTSYTPSQVADIYSFPAGTTGAGQTVAVIELGGGFTTSDLDAYFASLGLAVPSITAASVDGATNNPGDTSGADVEVSLDIDVIGAAAPGAAQVVYFAPNNGDQGFVDAISDAAQASPAPIAISISWGQSEDSWTAQGLSAMNAAMSDAAALGITVCVAAGDNGSTRTSTCSARPAGQLVACSAGLAWSPSNCSSARPPAPGAGDPRPAFQAGLSALWWSAQAALVAAVAGWSAPDQGSMATAAAGPARACADHHHALGQAMQACCCPAGGPGRPAARVQGISTTRVEVRAAGRGCWIMACISRSFQVTRCSALVLHQQAWLAAGHPGQQGLLARVAALPGWAGWRRRARPRRSCWPPPAGCSGLGVPDGTALLAGCKPGRRHFELRRGLRRGLAQGSRVSWTPAPFSG